MSVSGGSSGVALDTVAADIGILSGIAGAGAIGKAADAAHTHPLAVKQITANYNVLATDSLVISTNGVGVNTITLPAATSGAGRTLIIVNQNATGGQNVTISPAGADTLTDNGQSGQAFLTLHPASALLLVSDGTSVWFTNNQTGLQISGNPSAIGTIKPGIALSSSRSDHVHNTTNLSTQLAADVAVSGANAWTSAIALNLPHAGIWFIIGVLTIDPTTGAAMTMGARLQDTTNVLTLASGQDTVPAVTGDAVTLTLTWVYNVAGAATVALQGISTSAGASMKAALTTNGSGNNATTLVAVQIG